jgi:predicted nucleic acid-binding protein
VAFWDASAIVPLCSSQRATSHGRTLFRDVGRMIVWWGTPVEARSAFARLLREGRLSDSGLATAIRLLDQLGGSWDEIQPSPRVRSLAEQLPDQYGVRAADALQLAAALVWCGERPRRRPFICFDERLTKAATEAGFTVRR